MIHEDLQKKIDQKTKPLGSLGQLETLALQIGTIQGTLTPTLSKPLIIVAAGDHGLALDGVSPYPQAVTFQMVMNFLQGGAAINAFCRTNGIDFKIVDAGVNFDFNAAAGLIDCKVAMGTNSALKGPAMTSEQLSEAIEEGKALVAEAAENGCNVIGFGEMGIGNTASASLLMSCLLDLPLEVCVGRGTGWNDEGLEKKKRILKRVLEIHGKLEDAESILAAFGGFEIALITGGMIEASRRNMIILVDGFITTAANIAAIQLEQKVASHSVYSHVSNESGHRLMLEKLGVEPLLKLGLRLGEGTGAALAYPLLKSAVAFLNEMSSFEAAGVSEAEEETLQ